MAAYEIEITGETLGDLKSAEPLLEAAAALIDARYAGDLLDAITKLRDMDVRVVEYATNAIRRIRREAGVES